MRLNTISILSALTAVMVIGPFLPSAAADETAANKHLSVAYSANAFPGSALFDEAILSDNAIDARDQASRLPESERFEYLSR